MDSDISLSDFSENDEPVSNTNPKSPTSSSAVDEAEAICANLLPKVSCEKYQLVYDLFLKWMDSKNEGNHGNLGRKKYL